MITKEQYFWLLEVYNFQIKSFSRSSFCEIIHISNTNSKSYNQIINLLKDNKIISIGKGYSNQIRIYVDKNKLEKFIRKTEYYKKNDDFIHKSTFGAITG
ncbi:MAG: hypothetical protein KKF48_02740 [Nanoarchaeota archaeon]|nr:hypothetical protein [Nanoarchaeota archaeon]